MFQNFMMKQMLKKQLKGVPEAEQERIFKAIEDNPDFFGNIAKAVEERTKGGMSQTDAIMTVMKTNESKLREIMGNK